MGDIHGHEGVLVAYTTRKIPGIVEINYFLLGEWRSEWYCSGLLYLTREVRLELDWSKHGHSEDRWEEEWDLCLFPNMKLLVR